MEFLKKIFRGGSATSKGDFSAFFNHASRQQKIDLLNIVVKEANEDQRRLMKEVGKTPQEVG